MPDLRPQHAREWARNQITTNFYSMPVHRREGKKVVKVFALFVDPGPPELRWLGSGLGDWLENWPKGCLCSSSEGEDLEKVWPGKKVVKVITQACKVLLSSGGLKDWLKGCLLRRAKSSLKKQTRPFPLRP